MDISGSPFRSTDHPISFAPDFQALIRVLPNEILSSIFLFGHRSYSIEDPLAQRYLTSITAVCRFWRSVAIANSFLWTTIRYLPPPNPPQPPNAHEVAVVSFQIETFLNRSKNASLDVFFTTNFGKSSNVVQNITPIILPHFHRCRSIHLDLQGVPPEVREWLLDVLFPLKGDMSRVQELSLALPGLPRQIQIPLALFREENNFTKVENLKLGGLSTLADLKNFKMSSLTKLGIGLGIGVTVNPDTGAVDPPLFDLFHLLKQNSSTLTHLTLILPRIPHHLYQVAIVLPHLKSLTTNKRFIRNTPIILSCPDIEELTLEPDPAVSHFVEETDEYVFEWPKLRRLTLQDYIPGLELKKFLTAIHHLREIVLEETLYYRSPQTSSFLVLSALCERTLASRTPLYVPRLQSLSIILGRYPGPTSPVGDPATRKLLRNLCDLRPKLKVDASRDVTWMTDGLFQELLIREARQRE